MTKTKMYVNCISTQLPCQPTKFTLTEWNFNNQFRYRCTEAQQKSSERFLAEASRVCDLSTEIVKANKEDTDHQLKEKIDDIEYRKKELLRVRKDVVLEIDTLLTHKERITHELNSIKKNALAICKKCLVLRNQRLGIDLVRDDVERELLKEIELLQNAESSLDRILEETQEEIRKLKSILYCIDYDLENKEDNLRIDRHNMFLKETDPNLNLCQDILYHDKSITISEWEMQTNNNIINANKNVNCTKQFRCYIDKMMKRIIDGLNKQKDITDETFKQRIEEIQEAKIKLELHHSEIMNQISATSNKIMHIKKSIADKEGYMALAHERLSRRCQRPGMELTQDLVEINLIKEIHELRNIVANLQQMLCEAETSLRHLLRTQMQLEEDINVKTNTLRIDSVECTTLRHNIDYRAF